MGFGKQLRKIREAKRKQDPKYSLRKVAERIRFQQTYLSKVEREGVAPSDDLLIALAKDLEINETVLFAMAGKVSKRLQSYIIRRPEVFEQLMETMDKEPDHSILRIVRQVRDGEW
mgnify:CR=1 FL=1|jgi:transcriptional regulator with XRE-family HTH domain